MNKGILAIIQLNKAQRLVFDLFSIELYF